MQQTIDTSTKEKTGISLLASSFGWMFVGLLITTGVAVGIAFLLLGLINNAANEAAVITLMNRYMTVLIISGVVQLIMMIAIQFGVLRRGAGETNILIPYILYTANMGLLFSFIVLVTDISVIATSLGLTVSIFGIMALYARFTKRNLSGLALVGTGLIFGAIILALVNWILRSDQIAWIVTFALFGAIMLITMFDVWQINKISQTGVQSRNLALYFALNLYIDFIYILLRVIYFVSLARGRR
ncbi:MAG: Bax inhibitor-1 family protein [Bacilli bacterium]|jgi:hypothetical protein|nr:Bax inhibitor-1 family protein [Bacilli bacterium]MDD3389298.1 Bax inhibitor-1 family protein [Bacilli bacterium]MDD4344353.1 Bax inhibitor-1 family protein [Bacilli bacterium]MDD4521043.1 Bax inhibitor-1 family protein [Bacilli bacterium]MDY0399696.1 Bax inhibitor-1 family protein [Bacilli bacterium]